MTPVTGWFDPAPKGGFLRLAANSYLPAKSDAQVRLPGLRRGDLIVLDNGSVTTVNGQPAGQLDGRPDFANLGAVHPSRPLTLETPRAGEPLLTAGEVADVLRVSTAWVYAETRAQRLPHVRLGRYVRYRRSAILAWIDALEASSAPRVRRAA